jgi:hypothetical protein
VEKQKTAWRQAGFELAVRLAKFAFEIPKEFPAPFAKLGFRENFAPEVLVARVHLGLQGPVVLPVVSLLRGSKIRA